MTLLGRLSSIGLSPTCCNWFASYLTNRIQQVKTDNILSEPLAITKGVPQGSILGPILFSIYINDVAKAAGSSRIHLYADDTILYASGPSLCSAASTLQDSLTSIEHSFHNLHLRLNSKKTKCILFNRKNNTSSPPKIVCADNSELEFVKSYKYLGLWLDSSLSFSTHINNIQIKVKARLAFLFRNKASFTRSAKLTLVKMTILPIVDYGDTIYKMASKTALHKLDVLHHSAIRFATNAPFNTHHCELFKLVDWPSLQTRRLRHWLQFIYKTLLGKTPYYLSSLLHLSRSTYRTRSSELIKLINPLTRTTFGRNSFHFAAAFDWNKIQDTLKLTAFISQSAFKQKLNYVLVDPPCSC